MINGLSRFGVFLTVIIAALPTASAQPPVPPPGTGWAWQLSGKLVPRPVPVWDIDLFNTTAEQIASFKAQGKFVICYMEAGTYLKERPDAAKFPKEAIGPKMADWDDVYVDTRHPGVRAVMLERLKLAKSKGCDGYEPDVLDAHSVAKYRTWAGYPKTAAGKKQAEADGLAYIKWLTEQGRALGLRTGIKNMPEWASVMAPLVDFAVVEECLPYNECGALAAYTKLGKPVFHAEYTKRTAAKCATAAKYGLSTIFTDMNLAGKKWDACAAPTVSATPTGVCD